MSPDQPAPPSRSRPRARPGIKDVAALAGVSWKTVSNVVNGTAPVRPSTRARVDEAIAELGYRPNLSGRYLRQGRSNLLALAVADLRLSYFTDLAHAVVAAAGKRGYTVLLDETGGSAEAERHVAAGFGAHLLDGLIFSPHALGADELTAAGRQIPTVLLGEHALPHGADLVELDRVVIDNIASARQATEHLVQTGRRRIIFLGAEPDATDGTGALRREGYRQALPASHHPVVLPTRIYSRAEGLRVTSEHLAGRSRRPDAIVCANDQLAIGAMVALREAGLHVPRDVAVLGWDGSEEGQFAHPSLTTIAPDLDEVAETTLTLLLARIDGTAGAPRLHTLAHRLHVRESTGAPR